MSNSTVKTTILFILLWFIYNNNITYYYVPRSCPPNHIVHIIYYYYHYSIVYIWINKYTYTRICQHVRRCVYAYVCACIYVLCIRILIDMHSWWRATWLRSPCGVLRLCSRVSASAPNVDLLSVKRLAFS